MLTLQPLLSRNISLKYGEDHLSPSILGEEKSEKSEDVLSLSVIVLNGFSPKILKSHKKEKEKIQPHCFGRTNTSLPSLLALSSLLLLLLLNHFRYI